MLQDFGLTVTDHRVDGAPGKFTPLGICLHHTASRIGMDPMPSLQVVRKGRADLPGPLCNVLVGRDAKLAAITDGRANDTGGGDPDVLHAVRNDFPVLPQADDVDGYRINGNQWFYDIEVENDGVGESWSQAVIDATVSVAAAFCRHHGWTSRRVICHREWTRRKIDPSWHGPWRTLIAARLDARPKEDSDMEAAFVLALYEGFFNIRPDSKKPDGSSAWDVKGFDYWLKMLLAGTPRDQVRAAFAKVAGV